MELKTVFLLGHLAGLALGLGGVTVLDLYLLRFLRGASVRAADLDLVRFVARLVSFGLVLLWASGLGFIAEYWVTSPHLLMNGKLQAKILIVLLLTANGLLLHAQVLPMFARSLGRGLLEGLTRRHRILALGCAAISVTGWYAAFFLGALRELNFAAPPVVFLATYVLALGLVYSLAVAVAARFQVGPPQSERPGRLPNRT